MAAGDRRSFNNADLTPVQVNAFKKKAATSGQITVKVGGVKATIPVPASVLQSTGDHGFAFLSIPPINAVVELRTGGNHEAVHPKDVSAAVTALKSIRRPSKVSKKAAPLKMPAELESALSKVPKGHKIVFGPDGYKLVKTRPRAKK